MELIPKVVGDHGCYRGVGGNICRGNQSQSLENQTELGNALKKSINTSFQSVLGWAVVEVDLSMRAKKTSTSYLLILMSFFNVVH